MLQATHSSKTDKVYGMSYLQHGVVSGLQSVYIILLAQSCLQICIVWGWQRHSWKQVTDNAIEQRHIMAQELAQVHVNDGPQHQHVFIVIWKPVHNSHNRVMKQAAQQEQCVVE